MCWRSTPPAHLQLLRIAAALGLKPEAAGPTQQTSREAMEFLGGMPTAVMPNILTPAEYLANKAKNG